MYIKGEKTCAIEFDFSPGDFPATLDVDKNKNILKAINFGINETIQRPYKQNFDVIAGGYPDTHEKIDSDKLNKLIDELINEYEVVIFDIQPGLIKNSVDILKRSDKILIIMEDNIPVSVRTARILNWGMQNNAIDINKVNIVVNMAKGNLKIFLMML
jgi:CobQ/CobB/MinD/ParA nucleotide binding domain.